MKKFKSFLLISCMTVQVLAQSPDRPRKVILMIGDGMGLAQITAAMTGYSGPNAFERFQIIGLSKTSSADDYVTDSGAGATVFSIGKKTYNGAIGVGADSLPAENLFEKMKKRHAGTGVVATSSIVHATPAAFYAHVPSRRNYQEIAGFLLKENCDIAIGGGSRFLLKQGNNGTMADQLRKKGFQVIADSTTSFKPQSATKLIYTLDGDGMKTMKEGRGNFLSQASLNAMQMLSKNPEGYLLMIEGSQIDWGGHDMDFDYMKHELIDFNQTINAVLDQASKEGDVLVIVTADHETGGLSLNENPADRKSFIPHYTYEHHTGIMVPVFAFGPGAALFSGIYENTEIFFKIKSLLQLE